QADRLRQQQAAAFCRRDRFERAAAVGKYGRYDCRPWHESYFNTTAWRQRTATVGNQRIQRVAHRGWAAARRACAHERSVSDELPLIAAVACAIDHRPYDEAGRPGTSAADHRCCSPDFGVP